MGDNPTDPLLINNRPDKVANFLNELVFPEGMHIDNNNGKIILNLMYRYGPYVISANFPSCSNGLR